MPTLDRLPNEVLHSIASFLHKKYDLAALSRANRHCYDITSPILWKREAQSDRPGALHWAVENEDIRVLRRALQAGVDPSRVAYTHRPKPRIHPRHKWYNYHSSYYDDPMWRVQDDEHSVDLDASYVLHDMCDCFASGCDDGIFSDCRWEAIHVAASKGRIDIIEILLDAGASIDAPSWGVCLCRPHLPIDAFSESPAVDEAELEDLHGGNWTPLHVAICHKKFETAKFLLERGASTVIYQGIDFELDPTAWRDDDDVTHDSSRFKLTAMHHAAEHGMLDLLKLIVEGKYQEDINVEGPFMGTPLFQAVWYRHWDTIVPYLLEHGADLDKRLIETGLTPLMMTCFARRFDDAAKLVDLGSNVTTLSVQRFSILHLILGPRQLRPEDFFDPLRPPQIPLSETSEAEIVQKFIAKGFDVNAREALHGMTPLMVASASCNTDAMQALLEGGADVNALDHDGLTALARVGEEAEGAAILGLYDAAKMLLDAGATLEDSMEDITPLNIICMRQCEPYFNREWDNQHAILAKLLIERGADPNERGASKSRPFTEAIKHGNLAIAKAILENGGQPEQGDLEKLLSAFVNESYDDGKTEFILNIEYAKYGIAGPSEGFLVDLLKTALSNQLWARAADLMRSVPTPNVFRRGLIYRCLEKPSPIADEPSSLIQVLLDRGQDPNELFDGEPPLYYSFKSGSCWRTTPILVNAGADIYMPTKAMPDGALMYTITHNYQPQTCQLLAKHPHALCEKPERLHRQCWSSLIYWEVYTGPPVKGRQPGDNIPQINWTFTSRLISAGLRTDVKTLKDEDVKDLVERAIPKTEVLKLEGRKVLEAFDIPYVEPSVLEMLSAAIGDEEQEEEEEEEEEDFEYGSVSDEIDDHSDYSEFDSDGVPFAFFPPHMGGIDGEDDENDHDDQVGEDGWNEENSSDFDDYDDGAPTPFPPQFLFGFLI
ncbi:Alpha-latrotoxin-Lt1a [Fusarium austroafricanum]|uniref:Alpha-latrotoxin-Lt1a n=1 Tax=Fusarium austroafricanum TaxID=2364996 RepID=A0A8H4KGQ2_9HYPO|nr:Alpha-latrotoxin-Lt1a [Fusarium austroafricanum]